MPGRTKYTRPPPSQPPRWASPSRYRLALIGLVALCLGGCTKPLLSDKDNRSQYARYDAVRNQLPQQYVYDEYGARRPNLRQRLLPRD